MTNLVNDFLKHNFFENHIVITIIKTKPMIYFMILLNLVMRYQVQYLCQLSRVIKSLIKTVNFFNTKAKNIIKLSTILIKSFNSIVPKTREELQTLPGVGRKTANVILSVAFKKATIAVDTHIFRVSNRTKIAIGKKPIDVELGLEKIVPEKYKKIAHHLLILHGRYVCKARNPECYKCIVNDLCLFKNKNFNLKKNETV